METQKVLTSTEMNAEKLESDLEKAQSDLKARKELLHQIFDELSSLAPLRNNRPNIVEVLNAKPKRIDERKKPRVSIQLEWTIIVDSQICICVLINNEEDANGSNQSRKVIITTSINAFQNQQKCCSLFVDWLFLPSEYNNQSQIDPNFASQLRHNSPPQFSPLNYAFLIEMPKDRFHSQLIGGMSERNAINTLHCLYLIGKFRPLDMSTTKLYSLMTNCMEEDFRLADFGNWQIAVGRESSIWANIIVYIRPEVFEKLPTNSAVFSRSNAELDSFISHIQDI